HRADIIGQHDEGQPRGKPDACGLQDNLARDKRARGLYHVAQPRLYPRRRRRLRWRDDTRMLHESGLERPQFPHVPRPSPEPPSTAFCRQHRRVLAAGPAILAVPSAPRRDMVALLGECVPGLAATPTCIPGEAAASRVASTWHYSETTPRLLRGHEEAD